MIRLLIGFLALTMALAGCSHGDESDGGGGGGGYNVAPRAEAPLTDPDTTSDSCAAPDASSCVSVADPKTVP